MWQVLCLKADQSTEFTSELLSSENKQLQHTVPDKYFGTGNKTVQASFSGRNRYGVMLEHLRNLLQEDISQQMNTKEKTTVTDARVRQPSYDHCGLTGHLKTSVITLHQSNAITAFPMVTNIKCAHTITFRSLAMIGVQASIGMITGVCLI